MNGVKSRRPFRSPRPIVRSLAKSESARFAQAADGGQYEQSEPRGSVVAVAWNQDRAIDVGFEDKAVRGSVLNFDRKQFDVLDPVTLVIKLLEGLRAQERASCGGHARWR